MNIIITMAGKSSRFSNVGYNIPKFLINLGDKLMIEKCVSMFDISSDNFYFVMTKKQNNNFPQIEKILKNAVKNCNIILIDEHSLGPVETSVQASVNNNEPVIVSYCDFTVSWDYKYFVETVIKENPDMVIPSFIGFHPSSFGETYYAYSKVLNNKVQEIREKKPYTNNRHNEYAHTGIYYFKNFNLFKYYSNKLKENNYNSFPEGYVSLLTNYLIEDKKNVIITEVDKFICLGTPEDVEQYISWYNVFINNKDVNYFCKNQEILEYEYWKNYFAPIVG